MVGYLTKIDIDNIIIEDKKFSNSYSVHQALWQAFPESKVREFLYTFKEIRRDKHILVFSKVKPLVLNWGTWNTKKIPDSFLSKSTYYFEITLNPVYRKIKLDSLGNRLKNGQKVPVKGFAALNTWVQSKAVHHGFSLLDIHLNTSTLQHFEKKGQGVKFAKVVATGILKVEDKTKFMKAFLNGVGPSKAFGFGMLLLNPI